MNVAINNFLLKEHTTPKKNLKMSFFNLLKKLKNSTEEPSVQKKETKENDLLRDMNSLHINEIKKDVSVQKSTQQLHETHSNESRLKKVSIFSSLL